MPVKQRASPRRRISSGASDKGEESREEEPYSSQFEGSQDCDEYRQVSHPPASILQQTKPLPDTQSQGITQNLLNDNSFMINAITDIREVLKDLQMLSASLLGMETSQVTITDAQSKT